MMDVEEKFGLLMDVLLNVNERSWKVESNVHRYFTLEIGVCASSRTYLTDRVHSMESLTRRNDGLDPALSASRR